MLMIAVGVIVGLCVWRQWPTKKVVVDDDFCDVDENMFAD